MTLENEFPALFKDTPLHTHIIRVATNIIVKLPISVDAIKWASLCILAKATIFNTYCKHTLTQHHCLK